MRRRWFAAVAWRPRSLDGTEGHCRRHRCRATRTGTAPARAGAAAREQEKAQREQEKARRDREIAEREREKQELAKTVREVQSARERGLSDEATVILNAAFLKHGKADPLIQEQQKISQSLAEKQRVEAIENAAPRRAHWQKLHQFDEALRALDGAEVRYPGALPIAALRAEVTKERAAFQSKKDIEDGLAKASDMVQKGQAQSGLFLLEDVLKAHPESRELRDAAVRLKSRLEEEEKQRELNNVTGAIEKAIATQDWGRAVNQATGAFAKFPDPKIERLKRQAEEGKQRKDIEEAEAGIVKARDAGNLDLAAELSAAARIRWNAEKRFQKLEDEIAEARAEKTMLPAKATNAGKFDGAERVAKMALKQRPNMASATDLLNEIAARREAQKQRKKQEEDSRPLPVPVAAPEPAAPSPNRTKFIAIAVAAGLIVGLGIFWKLSQPAPVKVEKDISSGKSPDTVKPTPSPIDVKTEQPPAAAETITVSGPLSNPKAIWGQEYSSVLHAPGAGR